ncbi:TPA: hypothetical protein J4Q73_004110 [Escherichia coli]|nr:hypothetical protein [Escherichia coli]HBA5424828.1 hypothetical protein [Escherichia coli]HBA5894118.1 hypothetical protein [Escherichia coli]HBA5942153.1 hypothetical protein [Escherichia coli]HBA6002845.1 hypothetical protein [Escherichia coli]
MDTSLAHENARLRALLQTQQDTIRQMAEYNRLLSQRVAAYASEINRLKALAKLRQQGREQVDESALFRMIGQMREIVTSAQKATRKARRDADRRQHLKTSARPDKPVPPDTDIADPQADNLPPAKPFDQIEEW